MSGDVSFIDPSSPSVAHAAHLLFGRRILKFGEFKCISFVGCATPPSCPVPASLLPACSFHVLFAFMAPTMDMLTWSITNRAAQAMHFRWM